MANKSARRKFDLSLLEIPFFGRTLPWYWTPILITVLVIVMHLRFKLEIKDYTHEFLESFDWLGEVQFRNSDYSLGGTIESTDLEIVASEDSISDAIRIPRVRVETPGLFWIIRKQIPSFGLSWSMFSKKARLKEDSDNQFPPTDSLELVFERVDWGNIPMDQVLPEVSWVGPYSGAAFEAAGCQEDWWWHRSEFPEKFRLSEPAGDIRMLLTTEGEQILNQRIEFGAPESAHVIIERRFELEQADDFLDSDPEDWRTLEVRWSFRDHGFNKARNAYCAKQAGISEAEFIDRHLAAVARIMESKGLLFDERIWAAYRRYAEVGADLTWQTHYGEGVAWEDVNDRRGAALFNAIGAKLSVTGLPPLAYQPQVTAVRPLPEDGSVDSIYQLLLREGTLAAPAEAPAFADTAPAVPPAATRTLIPAAPAGAASSGSTPAAAVPSSTAANPVGDKLAAGSVVATRDLGQHIGRYVRVQLSGGRSYVGAIERNADQSLTLKVRLRGGSASIALPHKQIRSVTTI
jgi:hypothetical protein